MAEEARPNHLEQVLQAARERGRWLSDEEQEEKDRQQQQAQLQTEQQLSRRRHLTLLTAICVLLPRFGPWRLDSVLSLVSSDRCASWPVAGLFCCWGTGSDVAHAGHLECCGCCSIPDCPLDGYVI